MCCKEHEVYEKLQKILEIAEVDPLFGEYDLIVKLDAKSLDEVQRIVVDKIRKVEHVAATKTLSGLAL